MTPRERISAVLKGETPDRTPCDIWYTPEILDMLSRELRVSSEEELWEKLEIDKIVMLEAPYLHEHEEKADDGSVLTHRTWGNVERAVENSSGGSYMETVRYPLADAESVQALKTFSWPDPDAFDYQELKQQCRKNSRWTRMLTFISIFEIYCKLRPMDESLMDLYINQDLAHAIIKQIEEIQHSYIDRAFEACGSEIDIVYLSDDMGMQDRALLPIEKWNEMFREPYRRLINHIHEKGAYAFYHTDGAAFPVIEAMVSMGIDIINPIQHKCPGMEQEHLIEAFADRVAFHGAVENQEILPFGTPQQVQQEVRDNISTLGRHSRYICAPCHNLQPGTPLDNILALYRTDRAL